MAVSRINALLCTLPLLLTSSLAAAQQGDGGAATGNVPAQVGGGDAAGASGSSTGIVRLSTGAIVAIAIIVTVAIVCGILTATLFYQAKKRQWTIRETLRRSTRRVASGFKTVMSPLTPSRSGFSPDPFSAKQSKKTTHGPSPLRKGEKNRGIGLDVDMESLTGKNSSGQSSRDLEKGQGSQVVVEEMMRREKERRTGVVMKKNNPATHTNEGHKPQKPSITIPVTGRRASEQSPKTPVLSRIFGRS